MQCSIAGRTGCSAGAFNLLHRGSISGMEMDPGVVCRGHEGVQKERQGNRLCLKARGGGLAVGKDQGQPNGADTVAGISSHHGYRGSSGGLQEGAPPLPWHPGGGSRAGARNRRLLKSLKSMFLTQLTRGDIVLVPDGQGTPGQGCEGGEKPWLQSPWHCEPE